MLGTATRSAVSAVLSMLMCQPLAAQEQEDIATSATKTETGAIFEQKIGVDGSPISERYFLTRLICLNDQAPIDVMLPIDWQYAMARADTTYQITENGLRLTFQIGNEKLDKIVAPVPIMDKVSALDKGTVLSVHHGDLIWKALIASSGDKLLALTGGYGEFESISDDANLRQFEKICGLKR